MKTTTLNIYSGCLNHTKRAMKWAIFAISFVLFAFPATAQKHIDLSGKWDFLIDRNGTATVQSPCDDHITLPGSMLTNGKGDPTSVHTKWTGSLYDSSFYFNPYMEKYRIEGQMKFPFFLTPDKHYVGSAWYKRTVSIPKNWKKQRVILFLERPHIETVVYVNGHEAGKGMSLSVPHAFDITPWVQFGQENSLAIRVYNGIENVCVGQDSHSVTDQTQGNWNGIAGRIALYARARVYINKVKILPDAANKRVRVGLSFNDEGAKKKVRFLLNGRSTRAQWDNATDLYTLQLPADAALWDEFQPSLHQLTIIANGDTLQRTFGLRDIRIQGRQFYLNDRPIWLRGTVENCCFPLTGYPPTDVESWKKIIQKCKEYGLNFMRFHSYCPPDAAFTAADELGFYLQPEGPSWPNHGVKLGRGMAIDHYLLSECQAIVDAYGHHPSFMMMAAGNEPAGDWVTWCNAFVRSMHQYDSTRVYCGASVGGGWAWDDGSEFHVKGGARGLDWDRAMPHGDDDYYDQIERPRNYKDTDHVNNSPIIAHEQGQWCAFPDLKETSQYVGAYKARNFEIFSDLLRDHGMASQAQNFLMASGKLQVLAYKYEMERNLRTRDYAGFQLLGLNDYSGQGTALVGPLNVFWREKGYVTAREWTQFCAPIVPLAKLKKYVFTDNEHLSADVELYNASAEALKNATVSYRITDEEGRDQLHGDLYKGDLSIGKNIPLGHLDIDLSRLSAPRKYTLHVTVGANENTWDFWLYPETVQMPAAEDVYATDTLDKRAIETLQKGGKVLLMAHGKIKYGNDVVHRFLPVFWNTSWFKMRPPHTTGAYIDRRHPLFSDFPTDDWQNINWWELTNRAGVMNLSEFPADFQPLVQPIDTWHVSRKLGMLLEARVLNGRLLMTTIDIQNDLDRRVVARQLRKSILTYMSSEAFSPTKIVDLEVIQNLFTKTAPPVNMFTKDSPDELKPKLK